MMEQQQPQPVPIRLYQTENRIMLATPMPGLEPENITVEVNSERVVIRGELRGPGQYGRDIIVAEWTVGPYEREVQLPEPVSGRLTNATYGNGVLVLTMPKAVAGADNSGASFSLSQSAEATRGERVGHEGLHVTPTTTEAVRAARRASAAS